MNALALLALVVCLTFADTVLSDGTTLCATTGLNIRDGPCTDKKIVITIAQGTQVVHSGQASTACGYTWYQIQSQGKSGWAASNFLTPCGGAPPKAGSLADLLNRVGNDAGARSPGTQVAIAVKNLNTGEQAAFNGDVKHVSASSAKAIWVAAALKGKGPGPVQRYAQPIFANSDNAASGSVIDLVGANAVMQFYKDIGMSNSGFCQWGASRQANCPRAMGSDNYFTANDCAKFLTLVANEQLPYAATLKQWMGLAPKAGTGGWLGTKLPDAAKRTLAHKGGWLPSESFPAYGTMNDIGIVTTANGVRYVIAILARKPQDYWGKQARYVEYISCAVYSHISGQALSC